MATSSSASIRQRLLNLSKERGENFDYVLKVYLIQRVLYRLSQSSLSEIFLLKGAMLFWVWGLEGHRPTKDIDLLGYTSNDVETLEGHFRDICAVESEDGLKFDLDSIKGIEIKEDALYQGVRVTGGASLAGANITFQVDIGFGDEVTPEAETESMMSFLDLPEPVLKVYPVYTVVAEKFQAMVKLGLANSRIKDFYDVWVIANEIEVEGGLLAEAINTTFSARKTSITKAPLEIFQDEFTKDADKQTQWNAFLNKNGLESELTFKELMSQLQRYLETPYIALSDSKDFDKQWSASDWSWT